MIKDVIALHTGDNPLSAYLEYSRLHDDSWTVVFWHPWVQPSWIYKKLAQIDSNLRELDNVPIQARRINLRSDGSSQLKCLFVKTDKINGRKALKRSLFEIEEFFGRLDEDLVLLTVLEKWMGFNDVWRDPFCTTPINWSLFSLRSTVKNPVRSSVKKRRIIVRG